MWLRKWLSLPWHLYILQLLWSSLSVEFWHDGMNHSLMKTKLQSRTDQRKLKFPYSIENRQKNSITLQIIYFLQFIQTSVTFFPRTFPDLSSTVHQYSSLKWFFSPQNQAKNVLVKGWGGGGGRRHKVQSTQDQIELAWWSLILHI